MRDSVDVIALQQRQKTEIHDSYFLALIKPLNFAVVGG